MTESSDTRSDESDETAFGRRAMLRFQAGDDGAFDDIVRHWERPVRRYLHGWVRDRHRAEDLTQEVFLRVFRSRTRYVASSSFQSWLFTIASRLALNEIRSQRRRKRVFTDPPRELPEGDSEIWENAADHREIPPDAKAQSKELAERLESLIETLPGNQRAALWLVSGPGLSYREIAEALEISVPAVKSLLLRARETLRRALEPYLDGRPAARIDESSALKP